MTRNNKLAKLANAVREWRGVFNTRSKTWKLPPNEKAVFRVARWLKELKRPDVDGDIAIIGDFKSYEQFNKWISAL